MKKQMRMAQFKERAKWLSKQIPIGSTGVFECPVCNSIKGYVSADRITYEIHARCIGCGKEYIEKQE